MPRKSEIEKSSQESTQEGGIFDYLRFGESYTSLILGIVVVVIATVMLLSFVNNKKAKRAGEQATQVVTQQNDKNSQLAKNSQSGSPTVTVMPTAKPTSSATPTPIKAGPTEGKKAVTPTVAPTKVVPTQVKVAVKPTAKPTPQPKTVAGGTYVVAEGDTLWSIAEKHYKSGYNWVDIVRANNLSNPDSIDRGNKLIIPRVAPKLATVKSVETNKAPPSGTSVANKISGDSYKIAKGDSLWTIAVRAYGDGYKWVEIARVNNLSNPNIIHTGNTLKLPRGK